MTQSTLLCLYVTQSTLLCLYLFQSTMLCFYVSQSTLLCLYLSQSSLLCFYVTESTLCLCVYPSLPCYVCMSQSTLLCLQVCPSLHCYSCVYVPIYPVMFASVSQSTLLYLRACPSLPCYVCVCVSQSTLLCLYLLGVDQSHCTLSTLTTRRPQPHKGFCHVAVLVLLLSPEHGLFPMPEGAVLVPVQVSVMVWLPVPHVLEYSVRPDSAYCDHPRCTDTGVAAVVQILTFCDKFVLSGPWVTVAAVVQVVHSASGP